jgi:hypothetical protein
MPSRARWILILSAVLPICAGTSFAQDPPAPKFEYDKTPPKPTEWKVQAKGGLMVTTGNSQARSGVFGLQGSRQREYNKLSLDGQIAYGRTNVLVPVLDPVDPLMVTGVDRRGETTTNEWRARGRYDRFLTENNSLYILGQIGANKIAGKELFGGGQAGYSRQLQKTTQSTLVAELGYDFSHERYVQQAGKTIDPVTIHSARVFVGELLALTADTGLTASVEALFNLNKEKALDASDPTRTGVSAFKDTRFIGKLGLTTTLWKSLSFGFGFTLRYDQNPAPRPLPASAPAGAMFRETLFSDKVDTLTEATLIFTFL